MVHSSSLTLRSRAAASKGQPYTPDQPDASGLTSFAPQHEEAL
jgi:hypothetical protein